MLLPALPAPIVPAGWGVNVHFTDPKPGEVAKIAGAFRWTRMDFVWSATERERGRYDFAAYDRLLAALDREGVRPYLILDYGNDLYGDGAPRTDEARAAFCRWVAAALARFRGRGVVWEMWNEPNIGFWKPRPNVSEYVALARAVGETIRRVAPKETFVGPATSGFDWPFLQACLDAGLLRYWDAVSVHPYRQNDPESVEADWLRLRAMLDRAAPGRAVPMLSGEWGYSELYQGQTPARQADDAVRSYLVNLSCGVPLSVWYDWKDDGTDPKEAEHHFGTVFPDLSPKPAYRAVAALAKDLGGFAYVTRLHTKDEGQWVLLFRHGGEARLAAWTTGAPSTLRLPGTTDFGRGKGPRTVALGASPLVLSGPDLAPLLAWAPRPWATMTDDGLRESVSSTDRAFGEAVFEQRTRITLRRPVGLTVFPGRAGGTFVRVDDPYGRPLDDLRLRFADRVSSIIPWERETPAREGEIPVPDGERMVELAGKGTPIGLYRPVPRYVDLSLAGATATTDGDPKVRGVATATPTSDGLRFDTDLDRGWRFAELRPLDGRVEGRPRAFGLWVEGDGSGDRLRMRYQDATGQVFQPEFGPIDWKGWRYVSVPLDGSGAHWGGANDGKLRYPLRILTIALVEMRDDRGGKGSIRVARTALEYGR